MKTSTSIDGKNFILMGENEADQQLIDALALGNYIQRVSMVPGPKDASDTWMYQGAVLNVSHDSDAALKAQAGSQALSALRQLFSLGMSQAANHGHISTPATNPQPQEQLAACLVQIQVMLNALGNLVAKQEVVIKEINSAHIKPFGIENPIVKE